MFDFLQNYIEFGIWGITLIFVVYNTFRSPQIKLEKEIIKIQLRLDGLNESFCNLKDNHLHTLQVGLDETRIKQNEIENQVVKLCTIIEERIPSKK